MTRILHTIDTTGPGGAETVFVNLVKKLDPALFQSFAAIAGTGWVCDQLRSSGVEPIFVRSKGGFNTRYLMEIVRIIMDYEIDIVQSHLLGANVYSCLAGMLCRVPVVSTFHGFVDSSRRDRLMPVKRAIVNLGSRRVVFVSERLRQHFIAEYGFSAGKSSVIHNGIDAGRFRFEKDDSLRRELGLSADHILIGALGNIRPAKGYDLFLRAARIVHDAHPQTRFVVSGQGAGALYDSLLKLRGELDLEGIFHFIGFRDDAARILNNLDLFVLPSTTEGFSISTIEAMFCRVPVVVTRSGGPEEIVASGFNGLCVDCTHEDIAQGIIQLLDSRDLGRTFLSNAYEAAISTFSLSKMTEAYAQIYASRK